jgi:hypothetical protein
MGPRVFTPREANILIPKVQGLFERVDEVRERLRRLKGKMDVLEMIWGEDLQSPTTPDHREYLHYQEELETAKKDFEGFTRSFGELEVVIKSLEQGLVDFYGVIDGRLVFLCWKRGEKAVEFYHHLEEGYSGRQAIPAEELAR